MMLAVFIQVGDCPSLDLDAHSANTRHTGQAREVQTSVMFIELIIASSQSVQASRVPSQNSSMGPAHVVCSQQTLQVIHLPTPTCQLATHLRGVCTFLLLFARPLSTLPRGIYFVAGSAPFSPFALFSTSFTDQNLHPRASPRVRFSSLCSTFNLRSSAYSSVISELEAFQLASSDRAACSLHRI